MHKPNLIFFKLGVFLLFNFSTLISLSAQIGGSGTTIIEAEGPCDSMRLDDGAVNQSSTFGNQTASNARDNDKFSTFSQTLEEENPYWEIDLGGIRSIKGVQITWHTAPDSNYYILFYKNLPEGNTFSNMGSSEGVRSIHIASPFGNNEIFKLDSVQARYMRIQKVGNGSLKIGDVSIFGKKEICGNGLDDDCDGKIDCDDVFDCSSEIISVKILKEPTCKVCEDGKISVLISINNLQNLRISIDSGLTYINPIDFYYEFNNLNEGIYYIVSKNIETSCKVFWTPIKLKAPSGQPESLCDNGDFEDGSFKNWKGYTGIANENRTPPNIEGLSKSAHTIVSDGFDKNVQIILPFNGTYSARLGNDGTNSNAESLEYCFDVDNLNKNFSFNFAIVLQNPPKHKRSEQPYFKYEFFNNVNGTKEPINISKEIVADRNNPFFKTSANDIVYKGWTCETVDLSAYIGKKLCVVFTTADCTESGHFGYAYIDGLCSTAESNKPFAAFDLNEVYCKNQDIIFDATKSKKFNRYKIEVFKIIDSINNIELVRDSFVDYFIPKLNVVDYLSKKGKVVTCGDEYKIKLTLYNDCSTYISTEKKFKYICEYNTIKYKDIILCGVTNPSVNVMIEGNNDCASCSYTWKTDSLLNNPNDKFPIIYGILNGYAFKNKFTVQIRNQYGCIYNDTVDIIKLPDFSLNISPLEDFCQYKVRSQLNYKDSIANNLIKVIYKNSITGEETPGNLIGNPRKDKNFIFENSKGIYKKDSSNYTITVTWNFNSDSYTFVDIGNKCSKTKNFIAKRQSLYNGDFSFVMPNGFTPNGDGVNDTFFPVVPNSAGINQHNAYWAELTIFNEWGAIVHKKSMGGSISGPPFDFSLIGWDGKSNGEDQAIDTYTWMLNLKNCDHLNGTIIEGKQNYPPYIGELTLLR